MTAEIAGLISSTEGLLGEAVCLFRQAIPLTPDQFHVLLPKLVQWMQQTLAAHAGGTRTVVSAGFARLPQYYSAALLGRAYYVVVAHPPRPPLTTWGLRQFGEFERQAVKGVTYLNTYFVRSECMRDEALHFHELIHVVQWALLGAERFAAAYADGLEKFGYRNSLLEVMAFDAETAFRRREQFDAEQLVARQLSGQR